MGMDKSGFVKKLVSKTELNDEQAAAFLDAFSEVLADYFKKGEKVVIAEFGSFYVKDDKSVQFNPSSKLKDLVK
ncbi:MAG: HU family DNA-binding protein [Patescibacteria group bacterium]